MSPLHLFLLVMSASIIMYSLTIVIYNATSHLAIHNTKPVLYLVRLISTAGFALLNLIVLASFWCLGGWETALWTLVPLYVCYATIRRARTLYHFDLYFYTRHHLKELKGQQKSEEIHAV